MVFDLFDSKKERRAIFIPRTKNFPQRKKYIGSLATTVYVETQKDHLLCRDSPLQFPGMANKPNSKEIECIIDVQQDSYLGTL